MNHPEKAVCIYRLGEKIVFIFQEEDASDPREWDNLGTFWAFHKRYTLGDKQEHGDPTPSEFGGWKEFDEFLYKEKEAVIVLPVFMYDHSGITVSTSEFRDPFDSGRLGTIWVSREKVLKEYRLKRNITAKVKEKVRAVLQSEIQTYDDFVTGRCWYYVLEVNGEETDSCGGIYETYGKNDFSYIRQCAFGDDWEKSEQVSASDLEEDEE